MTFYRSLLTNHPLVNILFAVVLMIGLWSYASMPRENDPEISFNWVQITTVLPGASAEDVEKLVTSPLEDAIRSVQDLRFVSSQSTEGLSNILVRFDEVSDRVADKRIADVRREVQNKANDELPEDADDPLIVELTTSSGFPTALVLVVGQADDEVLRNTARQIQQDLDRIDGVDKVDAFGLHDPELHVEFFPAALAAVGLTAADVADVLRESFRDTAAGRVEVADETWLVRVDEATPSPDDLAALEIPLGGDRGVVRLDQVARVVRGREDPAQLVRHDGRPAVSLSVTKQAYTNTLSLIERINDYIGQRQARLAGSGIDVLLADDQTEVTRNALGVMENNFALGLMLVLLVCWAFLGLRIAAMVTLGIAFAITGVFAALNITGNTLNVSVLLGIVIVLGMLVDDAVVVVEAIYYRMQRGVSPVDAAIGAIREVGKPVTAAVLTTVAAFLPLMLLPGIVGQFMFVIPFVVTVGLLVSLLEAFWILPSHVIGVRRRAHDPARHGMTTRDRITHRVRLFYTRRLLWVLRHPVATGIGSIGIVATAAAMLAFGAVRIEFFTFDPIRIFYVNVDMPADAPIEETLRNAEAIEGIVRAGLRPGEARSITVLSGVKFTDTELLIGDQYGQIQVALLPQGSDGRSVSEIVDGMRPALAAVASDAEASFFILSGGPPRQKPILVKVRGDDFEELGRATERVKSIVAGIPGAIDVADNEVAGRSELVVDVDERKSIALGLPAATVARLLRLHTDGEIVSFIRDEGDKVELRVRAVQSPLDRIEGLLDDPVGLPDGGQTTLGTLVDFDVDQGRGVIQHYNFRRAIEVSADLVPDTTDTVAANRMIVAGWREISDAFPGVDLDFTGALDDIEESLNAMGPLLLFGVGLIYLVIATQFRSYFQPLLILLTLPMAATGVVFGLALTRNPMSLYTLYGVIALTGIAVNSAIVLIDAANERIRSGMRPLHATVYAARRRVIPILMTTSTTIAGLFSLAVGLGGKSLLWGPIAISIVSGLFVATFLTLFVVPPLYRFFMRERGRHAEPGPAP